jgi:hypothetical protein
MSITDDLASNFAPAPWGFCLATFCVGICGLNHRERSFSGLGVTLTGQQLRPNGDFRRKNSSRPHAVSLDQHADLADVLAQPHVGAFSRRTVP